MTSRQRVGAVALLWALLAAWPGVAAAQTGAASITGLVTDESGAAVPGVTVTATNQATNVHTPRSRTVPATTPSRRCRLARMS